MLKPKHKLSFETWTFVSLFEKMDAYVSVLVFGFYFVTNYFILLFYHTNCNSKCLRKRLQLFFVPCLVLFTKSVPNVGKLTSFNP